MELHAAVAYLEEAQVFTGNTELCCADTSVPEWVIFFKQICLAKAANKKNQSSGQSELMPLTPCALMMFKILLTAVVLIRVVQIHALSVSEKHRKTRLQGQTVC